MDVFHKVLAKIYEISAGRETQEVDFIELLKKEGFYANREGIKEHLSTEGWITEAQRTGHVRITHWGMAEAKKTLKGSNQKEHGIGPQLEKLRSAARDLSISVDELGKNTTAKSLKSVERNIAEITGVVEDLKNKI